MKAEQVKKQTETWITSFIVGYNICPFAQRVVENNRIHYEVIDSINSEQCLHVVVNEFQRLDSQPEIETSFIIIPNYLSEFEDYLDFLAIAETFLIEQNYAGIYQIASFHPKYCFEGQETTDPANYTNRSPYPMLHLIREASLEKALQSYPQPEKIPQRNIQFTRDMGIEKLQAILNKCYQHD